MRNVSGTSQIHQHENANRLQNGTEIDEVNVATFFSSQLTILARRISTVPAHNDFRQVFLRLCRYALKLYPVIS